MNDADRMVDRHNWAYLPWAHLDRQGRHHLKTLLNRRAYLLTKSARYEGKPSFLADEVAAIDWALGIIVEADAAAVATREQRAESAEGGEG